jgi:hypothetical protein
MFGIGHLFKKIQSSYAKELFLRMAVADSLRNLVGIEVGVENIKFKDSLVTLTNINQADRSTIYIKKEALLKEINKLQTVKKVLDIR